MRFPFIAALTLLLALGGVHALAQTPTFSEMIPARDGLRLATDVWLPGDDGARAWPVLLRRTPYGRAFNVGEAQVYNDLGFAIVSQDVRGRGGSEGRFLPFFPDAEDGYDTIEWVAAQPWSSGRIASFGGSAEGIVQYMALGAGPPSLDAAWILVAADDVHDALLPGGAWREELTTRWLENLSAPEVLAEWRAHEAGDEYWDRARLTPERRARVSAPVMTIAGFYDIFDRNTPKAHRALREQAAHDVRAQQYLVLGPWTHGGLFTAEGEDRLVSGELIYGKDASYRYYWFDFLDFMDWRLMEGPAPAWAPVRYFRTRVEDDGLHAGGTWLTAEQWPPEAISPVAMHLHEDGVLRGVPPAPWGAVAALPADPAQPVPSRGGGNLTTAAGVFEVSDIDAREDVLIAQSAPQTETLVVEGDVRARIWAATDSDDTDVVVRLSQVTPSGRVLQMTDGVLRGRFRESRARALPMTPGQPALFDVELGPVALELGPGHALRVAVQATSAPRYEPNPGSAAAIGGDPTPAPWTLTVYREAAHPSAILLPVRRGAIAGQVPTPPAAPEPVLDTEDAQASDELTADEAPPVPPSCPANGSCSAGEGGSPAALLLVLLLLLARRRLSRPRATSRRTPVRSTG